MLTAKRVGAIAGILAPLFAVAFVGAAIVSYPQFSWVNNALSDLGVVSGVTSVLFTVGLCGTGVLALVFSVLGLYVFVKQSLLAKVGSVFFAASTIALVCIGVFNESFRPTHHLVSVLFFVLAPLAFFILTCAFWRADRHGLAAFTAGAGVVAAAVWILEFTIRYVPEVAIPEAVSAAAISLWVIVLCSKILRSK